MGSVEKRMARMKRSRDRSDPRTIWRFVSGVASRTLNVWASRSW
jgi:hypothetical protein